MQGSAPSSGICSFLPAPRGGGCGARLLREEPLVGPERSPGLLGGVVISTERSPRSWGRW